MRFRSLFPLLLLLPAIVAAQPNLSIKWMAYGWQGWQAPPEHSADGSAVLFRKLDHFGVSDAVTGMPKRIFFSERGSLGGACLNQNGSIAYYSGLDETGKWRVFRMNVATGLTETLNLSETYPIENLKASTDGATLIYTRLGETEDSERICVYSLSGAYLAKRFVGHPPVAFFLNNSAILARGPKVFDFQGNILGQYAESYVFRSVSHDQQRAYSGSSAWSGASLELLWAKAPVGVNPSPADVSWDDQALVMAGLSDDHPKHFDIKCISTADGNPLACAFTSAIENGGFYPFPNPGTNKMILMGGWGINEFWQYDPNGSALFLGMFSEGLMKAGSSMYALNYGGTPAVAINDGSQRINKLLVRNAANGSRLVEFPLDSVPNLTGEYRVGISGSNVEVRRLSDDSLAASTSLEGLNAVGWVNENQVWAKYRPAAGYKLSTFTFNGTTLSFSKTANLPANFLSVSLDTGGTRSAVGSATRTLVYDMNSGSQLGQLPAGVPSVLNEHLLTLVTSDATTAWQSVYDITSTPVLLRKVNIGPSGTVAGAVGAVSNDGQLYASIAWAAPDTHALPNQGSIRIYRALDGAVVRQWDNQLLGNVRNAAISTDSKTLVWGGREGQLIATDIPAFPTAFTLNKASLTGGQTCKGTLTLNRAVDADTKFSVAYGTPLSGPAKVTVVAGQSTATFTIKSTAVSSDTPATVTVDPSGAPLSASVTVLAPVVKSLSPSSATVTGPTTIPVTITLTGPAPAGFSVPCNSSQTAIEVPSTVSFTEGATTAKVVLNVKQVSTTKKVTVLIGGKKCVVTILAG